MLAPAREYVPGEQAVYALAPAALVKEPAGTDRHPEAPGLTWYWPGAQLVQLMLAKSIRCVTDDRETWLVTRTLHSKEYCADGGNEPEVADPDGQFVHVRAPAFAEY
jgi:hypothetical protein